LAAQANTQKLKQDVADELDAARTEVQQAYDDAGGGESGVKAAMKVPGWTKLSSGQQAQIRLSQPSGGSFLEKLLSSEAGSPSLGKGKLTPDQAKDFLRQAGGDKDKARKLAKDAGYSF
jgi:hypothetical protein